MNRFTSTSSPYVVLRVDPEAHEWLEAAQLRASEAPDSIRALLVGWTRFELSVAESEEALTWAATLPGWHADGRPALAVHMPGESLAGT